MTAAVQPGNSGGPVLDGSGALLGVTVARMNDVAALMATNSVPQTVNFGIKGDIAASFLRVNGVEPKTGGAALALTTPQIAAGGMGLTTQVTRQGQDRVSRDRHIGNCFFGPNSRLMHLRMHQPRSSVFNRVSLATLLLRRNGSATSKSEQLGSSIMSQLVTSDQFITGVLSQLALNGRHELKLVDTLVDSRFEQAYSALVDQMDELGVEPDFSLLTNPYHGDSETLRETLYSIRERGVVAINNPSFKTIEIKMSQDDAEQFLRRSPLPKEFFSEIVRRYFGP